MKIKRILTILIICFVCGIFFVGVGYFYLDSQLEDVKQNVETVPYYIEVPDNVGIVLEIAEQQTFFFLDFNYKSISVIYDAEKYLENDTIMGYQADHYIVGDIELLGGIIDIVGGIELENNGELLRHTGVQITDILTTSTDYDLLERSVIQKIIEKIGENGFQKQDFLYIIENSNTTLTVPICYYWSDYMKDLCGFVNEVN